MVNNLNIPKFLIVSSVIFALIGLKIPAANEPAVIFLVAGFLWGFAKAVHDIGKS